MQEFTIFDMVIVGITLILGIKGLFRGLIKEVFGIIGIIGAIFVASRVAADIGNLIAPFLGLESQNTIKLIGFVASLIGFWLIVYVLGIIFSKIFSASGLGLIDRIFGFIFGAAKVFLIFSVIAYALYQVQSFKNAIDENTKGSFVMPHLLSVGSYIIKLDTSAITNSMNNAVDNVVDKTKEITNTQNEEKTSQDLNNTEKTEEKPVSDEQKNEENSSIIEKKVEETATKIKNATEEQIDTVKEKLQSIVNKEENNN